MLVLIRLIVFNQRCKFSAKLAHCKPTAKLADTRSVHDKLAEL